MSALDLKVVELSKFMKKINGIKKGDYITESECSKVIAYPRHHERYKCGMTTLKKKIESVLSNRFTGSIVVRKCRGQGFRILEDKAASDHFDKNFRTDINRIGNDHAGMCNVPLTTFSKKEKGNHNKKVNQQSCIMGGMAGSALKIHYIDVNLCKRLKSGGK